ncbi:conserved hypothetical protein, partial [Ricinus communis]
ALPGNADASVADRKTQSRHRLIDCRSQDHAAAVGEFHGIAEQIDQHLTQFHLIEKDVLGQLRRQFQLERQALVFRFAPHDIAHGLQQPVKIAIARLNLQCAAFDLRKVKHIIDQREQMLAATLDREQMAMLLRRQLRIAHQYLRIAEHAVERCP